MKLTDAQFKKVLNVTEKCLLAKNKGYDVFLGWSPHCCLLEVRIYNGKWKEGVPSMFFKYQNISRSYPSTRLKNIETTDHYEEVAYETEIEEMLDSLKEIENEQNE